MAKKGKADPKLDFSDVEKLVSRCRFRGCKHGDEPGCAIQEALRIGALDPERFESYLVIQKKLAYEERKSTKENLAIEKERWAKVQSDYREKVKARRKDRS